jgi:hypothetical protein
MFCFCLAARQTWPHPQGRLRATPFMSDLPSSRISTDIIELYTNIDYGRFGVKNFKFKIKIDVKGGFKGGRSGRSRNVPGFRFRRGDMREYGAGTQVPPLRDGFAVDFDVPVLRRPPAAADRNLTVFLGKFLSADAILGGQQGGL